MPVDLEIVSPEKLLLSKPVDMVVLPAAEGEMGVLVNHAPMIVLLRGGVIRLYQGQTVTEQLYVSGGFAEVTSSRVTVLATEATPVAELKRGEGQSRLSAAEAEYSAADKNDVTTLDAIQARMQAARALIEAAPAA
jgi:F-type H+-transporting ATPase subunit epsilon